MATFGAAWQGPFYVETNVVLVSQSVANNTSTIDVAVWFNATSQSVNASFTANVGVGGTLYGSNTTQRVVGQFLGAPNAVIFASTRVTVPHNADGSLSLVINGTVLANNTITFHQTSGGTYTFPKIPRATTPTWGTEWFTAGTTRTISLPRPAGTTFVHDVTYTFGSMTGTIGTNVATSVNWTIPPELLTQIPNTAYGNGTIRVVTKQGTTTIGATATNFFLSGAGTAGAPDLTLVEWTDANTVVASAVGLFVQGLSLPKASITAAGRYGATIAEKFLEIGTANTRLAENTSFTPASSGTYPAKGVVRDTRGTYKRLDAPITVLPYTPPTLVGEGIRVFRANSSNVATPTGTYLSVAINARVETLKNGTTEKNALRINIRTRPLNGAWTARNSIVHGSVAYNSTLQVQGGSGYAVGQSYEVEVTISDKVGGAPIVVTAMVPTAATALDLRGTNVGVGKYHEQGALDVGGDIYSSNAIVYPVGTVTPWFTNTAPAGHLFLRGQNVSRVTYAKLFALWGTTYGAGDGTTTFTLPDLRDRVIVGLSTATDMSTLGQKGGAKTHTLTVAEMPNHDHQTGTNSGHRVYGGDPGTPGGGSGFGTPLTSIRTGTTGGGGAHNNLQPYIVANYIVRAL